MAVNIFSYVLQKEKTKKKKKRQSPPFRFISLLGHYLFLEAHSFPNAKLLGADNVHRKISKHIFAPSGGYGLCFSVLSKVDVIVGKSKFVVQGIPLTIIAIILIRMITMY